jgi:L-asparaginase II
MRSGNLFPCDSGLCGGRRVIAILGRIRKGQDADLTSTAVTSRPFSTEGKEPMTGQFARAVEIVRGSTVESVHYAAAAVVDHNGKLVASLGDPDYFTFSRSSLKPFQALPSVMRGFPERFGLTERHLAVACASHSGELRHVRAAQEILDAINASVSDLQCGTHIPIYMSAGEGAIPAKSEFSAIHNNCSGKHSTMLALSQILDAPRSEYLKYDGAVQSVIREAICECLGVRPDDLAWGIDGCSAPNYSLPISKLATGFARLAWAAAQQPERLTDIQRAAAKIARAMMNHPEMISGVGRFDLELVEAAGKTIFAKTGAEGLECIGVPSKGLGVTVKIADGSPRAIGPVVVSILTELDALDTAAQNRLEPVARPRMKNVRGTEIGTARCVSRLQWA